MRVRYFAYMLRPFLTACCVSLSIILTGCSSTPVLPDPTGTPTNVRRISDYLLAPLVGMSTTLRYTTRDISVNDDTTTVVYADYRYTVVDTAFAFTLDKRARAVQRETIKGDGVTVDTTYHWANTDELITYERLSDAIGRRRLAAPLAPGTTFLLRTSAGNEPANTYRIMSCVDTVITPVRTFTSCVHVRMQSSTETSGDVTVFSDDVWLSPGVGIVRQLQTRITTDRTTQQRVVSLLEFSLVALSL